MRHRRSGRKLGRDASHRKALFSNMAGSLFEHGRIRTTEAKAKELRPIAEKLITLARRDPADVAAQREAVAYLRSKDAVHNLFHRVGPRFVDRPVVDQTGLTDKYDFTLTWRPDPLAAPPPNAPPPPADLDSRSDLFTAVQEQLGLKLEATKTPVEVLVIERVQKPSEN